MDDALGFDPGAGRGEVGGQRLETQVPGAAQVGGREGRAIRDVTPASLIMYGSHERDLMESAAFWAGKAIVEPPGKVSVKVPWARLATVALMKFIFGEPMKPATNVFCGRW